MVSRRMPGRRYRTNMSGEGSGRIADGEEIEKERVSYHRDNWRDSNGQREEGGKKGETRHPKAGPVIPEIGNWNAGRPARAIPYQTSRPCHPSVSLPLPTYALWFRLDPRLRTPLSSAIIKSQPLVKFG